MVGETYLLQLGFAETYQPACANGARVMNIFVNDEVFASGLDVHAMVGCESALVLGQEITVPDTSKIDIRLESTVERLVQSVVRDAQDAPVNPMAATQEEMHAAAEATTPNLDAGRGKRAKRRRRKSK